MLRMPTVWGAGTALVMFIGVAVAQPVPVAIYHGASVRPDSTAHGRLFAVLEEAKGITPFYLSRLSPDTMKSCKVIVLWNEKIKVADSTANPRHVGPQTVSALRQWVRNGGGLLCYADSVGFSRHGSDPIFPAVARGISNPYPDQEGYKREWVVTRPQGAAGSLRPGDRSVVSYYDHILLEAGADGVTVARAVTALPPRGNMVGTPLVVCGQVGKGRYVANGMFTGLSAAGNQPVPPEGMERRLLLHAVTWLAGQGSALDPAVDEEPVKGAFLSGRNLVFNPSCELVERGRPAGWGAFVASGHIAWGASKTEAHSGRYSASIRPAKYRLREDGKHIIGAALVAGDSSGYQGHRATRVKPTTVYHYTFWIKSEVQKIQALVFGWPEDGEQRHILSTSSDWIDLEPTWVKCRGQFTTGPDTRRAALAFKFENGVCPVPLGAMVYVDDVSITQGETVSSVRDLAQRSTTSKRVDWQDTMTGQEVALERVPPKTPLPMNGAYIELPMYSHVPEGWRSMDLAGLWKIRKLADTQDNPSDDPGTKQGYWKPGYNDTEWDVRPVPGSWEDEDVPEPPMRGGAGKRNRFTGVGWYRRRVVVPSTADGERYLLSCEGIADIADIWVNGQKVVHHVGGLLPFRSDITESVRPGTENTIAVRVFDSLGATRTEFGGIWNRISILTAPSLYARRVLVTPRLADATIEVDAWLVNAGETAEHAELAGRVFLFENPLAQAPDYDKTVSLGVMELPPGETRKRVVIPVKHAVCWWPSNPALYVLELTSGPRRLSKTRFGYREFGVRDAYFEINGHRAPWLRSVMFHRGTFNHEPRLMVYNEGNFMKRYLYAFRGYHGNMIYPMASVYPRTFYDLCDELGIMIYDEWDVGRGYAYPRNTPVESEPGIGCYDAWVYAHYNHACVVMRSLAGELQEKRRPAGVKAYKDLLDPLYERVKALDRQDRPVCPSSGKRLWHDGDQTDFCDLHFYPGTINDAWVYEQPMVRRIREKMLAMYGREMPLIQFEFNRLGRWLYGYLGFPDMTLIAEKDRAFVKVGDAVFGADEDWDTKAFVDLVERGPALRGQTRALVGLHGLRRYLAGCRRGQRPGVAIQKRIVKHAIEDARRCGDLLQGIAPYLDGYEVTEILVDGEFVDGREKGLFGRLDDLENREFVAGEVYELIRRVWNPRWVCLNVFDKNAFAGERLKAMIHAVNDRAEPAEAWRVRAVVRSAQGQRLMDHTATVGPVAPFERVLTPYTPELPSDLTTGFYRLELFLYDRDEVVSDNVVDVFVLGADDRTLRLARDKTVALYDRGRDYLPETTPVTAEVLEDLEIPYDEVTNFGALANWEVLIIGAFSFDVALAQEADHIRRWVARGGQTVARYVLRYADGHSTDVAVVGGLHVAAPGDDSDVPEGIRAGDGLFVMAWDNPDPQRRVASLDVIAAGEGPFVLNGITCKLIRSKVHE